MSKKLQIELELMELKQKNIEKRLKNVEKETIFKK